MGSELAIGYRPGTVSRQDPPPNAPIPRGEVVSYWLTSSVAQVPFIMGQSAEDAEATLRQYHLVGRPMGSEPSTEYRPGTVSRQEPHADATIPQDGVVRYWLVAATPTPAAPVSESLIPVPNVMNFELKRGFAEISKARLVPQFVSKERSNRRSGEIARQEPPAGTLVKPGSSVRIWVAKSVLPPPPPRGDHSPWDWKSFPQNVRLGMAIILSALITIIAAKFFKPNPPELVPFKDYGEQRVTPPGPLVFALELNPVLDLGDQQLEKVGPLVATEGG
jgi:hypothetical protein